MRCRGIAGVRIRRGLLLTGLAALALAIPAAARDREGASAQVSVDQLSLRQQVGQLSAGVPIVMIGHARYPALDPDHIASQSREIVVGLLRAALGFRGVVVTDSMEAEASLATGDITTVSERAVRAGVDLVLLTGRGSYTPVYGHLLAVAQRSPSFRARLRGSAARVLALKQRRPAARLRAGIGERRRGRTPCAVRGVF